MLHRRNIITAVLIKSAIDIIIYRRLFKGLAEIRPCKYGTLPWTRKLWWSQRLDARTTACSATLYLLQYSEVYVCILFRNKFSRYIVNTSTITTIMLVHRQNIFSTITIKCSAGFASDVGQFYYKHSFFINSVVGIEISDQ